MCRDLVPCACSSGHGGLQYVIDKEIIIPHLVGLILLFVYSDLRVMVICSL